MRRGRKPKPTISIETIEACLKLLEKGDYERSLIHFTSKKPENKWNNAPLINKWYALNKLKIADSLALSIDYREGNFGVKSNIIAYKTDAAGLDFTFEKIRSAAHLHRQAYLLNSTYLFDHDSLQSLVEKELEKSLK